ncbi:MAG: UDP-N-acetylmuramate--L-alanine ligase [Oscillospiraceae bacterium]|nr:UDP-N-acetylmuramate--L-alanine ligase [Oscillospiraceae bacterium]
MDFSEFEQHIKSGEKIHLVGIGGVSMSPLAEILHDMGIHVSGSDVAESPSTKKLRAMGIDVKIGHFVENIEGVGSIIRTAAAREDNAEINAARACGIPVFERAQAWGYIMRGYKNAVCIAGVHGKTTTTSMMTHILLAAKTDPTIMIGGTLPVLGSGYRVGKGEVIVAESCEYYNSFHSFSPTVAVILNVDIDHIDFFTDIDHVKSSFRKFASLVPENGHIVCNFDDAHTMDTLTPLHRELLTFGFGEGAKVRGVNASIAGHNPSMDILYDNQPFCKIKLNIPGVHNLKNALAAAAAAMAVGISPDAIERGLNGFEGVGRRFEYKGTFNGADIYDDYAHHPNELKVLLDAVESLDYERIILAFQPHTFSRTKALFDDFTRELQRPDVTFLSPIYAARESDDISISSDDLAQVVSGAHSFVDFPELTDQIRAIAREGDIVLTVGAGDIFRVGEMLVEDMCDE